MLACGHARPRISAWANDHHERAPAAKRRTRRTLSEGKRGGAIGGIVVGSVFWMLLPMSIPVLITQSKKLKAHNKARYERRCQYALPQ